jgi:hypothetical protein
VGLCVLKLDPRFDGRGKWCKLGFLESRKTASITSEASPGLWL